MWIHLILNLKMCFTWLIFHCRYHFNQLYSFLGTTDANFTRCCHFFFVHSSFVSIKISRQKCLFIQNKSLKLIKLFGVVWMMMMNFSLGFPYFIFFKSNVCREIETEKMYLPVCCKCWFQLNGKSMRLWLHGVCTSL